MTTYNAVVSFALENLEESYDEFVAYLPTAISLAEERLFKDLDYFGFRVYLSVPASPGAFTFSRPDGVRVLRGLYVWMGGTRSAVHFKPEDYIDRYNPTNLLTGTPKYYTNKGESTFVFAPATSTSCVFELRYDSKPNPLTSSNQTNFFTKVAANALRYAVAEEASRFLKNIEATVEWSRVYQQEVANLRDEAGRNRRDDQQNSTTDMRTNEKGAGR